MPLAEQVSEVYPARDPAKLRKLLLALLKYVKNRHFTKLIGIFDICLDLRRLHPGFFSFKTNLIHEEKKFLVDYCFNDGGFAGRICNAAVLHQGIV
ncbi:hypothetical protein GCM10007422_31450 [Pedobacter zeae]|uniref:Uncharacterized protein n=1 Tax=Pedobacter zeae TaxID=1737356 RepID=A0ABQ1Y409_9SPHI|nr:hypothetical protein GCM10007422_31450 [Pedobacter zeae]